MNASAQHSGDEFVARTVSFELHTREHLLITSYTA